MITQDGMARLRKADAKDRMLLDWNEIKLVFERGKTVIQFKQDRVVVAEIETGECRVGDTLSLDGDYKGVTVVTIDQR